MLRAAVLSEGVHGHRALQDQLERLLGERTDIAPRFATVPAPGRLGGALLRRVEWLGDLDLQPLRWRLRWSFAARRLARVQADAEVVFVDSQACALLARWPMRMTPWILSVDATGSQFAELEYWRARGRFSPVGERPLEALERRAYRGAFAVMAWTEWTAGSLRRDYGVPEERLVVMHPGVDPHPAVRGRPAGHGEDSALRVLFVGHDVERKGLPLLRGAIERSGVGLHLDVVTNDELGAAPGMNVHRGLAPGSPELWGRFAEADVLALPSRADAAPFAVLEGMAAGLAVVATDVGAIRELVGDAGLIVAREDQDALARALDRLAGQPRLRQELGERGRRRVEERYDARVQADRLVRLMRDAAHGILPTSR